MERLTRNDLEVIDLLFTLATHSMSKELYLSEDNLCFMKEKMEGIMLRLTEIVKVQEIAIKMLNFIPR